MDTSFRRLQKAVALLFRLLARIEVVGAENVPSEGGLILATNHISRLDTPLLGIACPRRVYGMVAEKYKSYPFFHWFLKMTDPIWVRRSEFDRSALMQALQLLEEGKVLGLAPEGTRSRTASLQPGKPGVAFLAAHAHVPLLPVAITGTEQMGSRLRRLQRMKVRVVFGEPFRLEKEGRLRSEELAVATQRIMVRIARLLPPSYRGAYAGDVAQLEAGDGTAPAPGSPERRPDSALA